MNKPKASLLEMQLAELYGRINYERQSKASPRSFKLQNMREFLHRLGDPHLQCPVVHVAGTKGKGSVATMVGQILAQSGLKTGVYTSPHLETIHQRMAVNGQLVSDDQLSEVFTQLQPVLDQMDHELNEMGERPLTFFEVTTAATFQFFANQKTDIVVLEVGLGGRLDSTNVCEPAVCIITNISLDHTKQLGDTVDKIAFEKAGIIKPGVPVISGALNPLAATVIKKVAAENDAPLAELNRDFSVEVTELDSKIAVRGDSPVEFSIDEISLGMPGKHQQQNASLAVAACQSLNDSETFVAKSWSISEAAIRSGLGKASLAGRTEVLVGRDATVVLDMAHNGASVAALVSTLKSDVKQWTASPRRRMVIATTRDKDTAEIVCPLAGLADELILTKYQKNPRGKPVEDLVECINEHRAKAKQDGVGELVEPITISNPEQAWRHILNTLEPNDAVCFAGSAFLIAEVRPLILNWLDSK